MFLVHSVVELKPIQYLVLHGVTPTIDWHPRWETPGQSRFRYLLLMKYLMKLYLQICVLFLRLKQKKFLNNQQAAIQPQKSCCSINFICCQNKSHQNKPSVIDMSVVVHEHGSFRVGKVMWRDISAAEVVFSSATTPFHLFSNLLCCENLCSDFLSP